MTYLPPGAIAALFEVSRDSGWRAAKYQQCSLNSFAGGSVSVPPRFSNPRRVPNLLDAAFFQRPRATRLQRSTMCERPLRFLLLQAMKRAPINHGIGSTNRDR